MNFKQVRAILIAAVSTCAVAHANMSDEQQLEQILRNNFPQESNHQPSSNFSATLPQALKALNNLKNSPEAQPKECKDQKIVNFAGKYALSYDIDSGKPCKIYDLSFPTLKTAFAPSAISKVPATPLKAKDYLNWIRGDYSKVYQQIDTLRAQDTSVSLKDSWVTKLKFKSNTVFTYVNTGKGGTKVPKSFYASDLEVGKFEFSAAERRQLQSLYSQVVALQKPSSGTNEELEKAWYELLNNPKSFLSQIRFDWNELEKVYDIFLEGQFIPLNGPIALVDYNAHYKTAVESILRNVLATGMGQLAKLIPDIVVRNLVSIAIADSFSFLDLMYASQMAQLEDTLRAGLNGGIQINAERATIDYGLNVLSGAQTSLVNEYVLAMAQGREFNWTQLEEIGRVARYRTEKARNNLRAKLNSNLVLGGGCSMEIVNTYFGICSKAGKKHSIFSLISDPQIFFWKAGAPMLHRYALPAEVTMRRTTAWLLSSGLRIFDIPFVPNFLIDQFSTAMRDFAKIGLTDEVYLKNHLWLQKQAKGTLAQDSEKVLSWLYIQNINPFSPKSESIEAWIIKKNWNSLNKSPALNEYITLEEVL